MKQSLINYYKKISNKSVSLIKRAKMTEHSFMIIVALIIGTLAGFGAISIRAMIKFVSDMSFPGISGTDVLLHNIIAAPWYIKLFVPALGGLVVGPIIYFFAREAKGHGVPEVMQAMILKGGEIRPRVAFVKAIASVITIGTGGSVGREGPIVQIGASLGSTIGKFFKVSPNRMKTFVGCGAAAGIAAAFNAPIAGALFAVEILLGDFAFTQFSPIVISSVMATVVSHHFEGNFAAFQVPTYRLASPYELIFYFILAVLCAVVSLMFIKVLYFSEDFFDEKLKFPEYLKPVLGGLLLGSIALYYPEIMGVGYDSINEALQGNSLWYFALLFLLVKIIATSITLGSGGSGGIFAPSLFLGAMIGSAFGWVVHFFFPGITATPGAYALVAMGGLVAGTTHAPITAIIIVFELTNDYHIILPLMITCIISTLLSSKFSRESIYTLKLIRRNILVKNGAEMNLMKSIHVKDVFSRSVKTILNSSNFNDIVNDLVSSKEPALPVIEPKGTFAGIISIQDIKEYLFEKEMLQNIVLAGDIADGNITPVTPADNCQTVLDIISSFNVEGIPVVDSLDSKKLVGMIWRQDVLNAYKKETEKRDFVSNFANRITAKNIDQHIHFMEGYAITEIPVPVFFVGKSIKDLNIRAKFGVDILLIRINDEQGSRIKTIPDPNYKFSYNDSLVIAGEIGKLNLLKSLS